MTFRSLLKHPSAFLPVAMSAAALALLLGYVALFDGAGQPDGDEGAAARIFQMLMVAQVLIIAVFSVSWLPRAPRAALLVLATQIGAALIPIATILFLES